MTAKIRVAILDDHQSIIDGYCFRISQDANIEVVATAYYGDELDAMIAQHELDVLILDINVPISQDNLSPYPILHFIPQIIQQHPDLSILVISMHHQASLVKSVMEAGASGYIMKDDRHTIQELASVVRTVASGGVHMSKLAHAQYFKKTPKSGSLTPRQREALSLCAAFPDKTSAEIAHELGIANSTLRNLLSEAYLRLAVRSRPAAVAKARRLGMLTPEE